MNNAAHSEQNYLERQIHEFAQEVQDIPDGATARRLLEKRNRISQAIRRATVTPSNVEIFDGACKKHWQNSADMLKPVC